ncbi:MAG: hypothetical protein WB786_05830, partial [Thermoplasmata archaeon]
MTGTTLVVGELHDGALSDASKEAVGVALGLFGKERVVGFLMGPSVRVPAGGFGRIGVVRTIVAEDPRLEVAVNAVAARVVA